MGFLDGVVEHSEHGPRLRMADGTRLAIAKSGASPGRPAVAGIRPEHFRLAAGGEGFAFVVAVVEPTGAETHLFGSVGGTTMRAVFRERLAPRPGEVLRLTVEPSSVHVFDPATELRL